MSQARQEYFVANPFAMLLDPERVARDAACSQRLARLQRRVCRPLDKPLIAHSANAELEGYDQWIDDSEIDPDPAVAIDEQTSAEALA